MNGGVLGRATFCKTSFLSCLSGKQKRWRSSSVASLSPCLLYFCALACGVEVVDGGGVLERAEFCKAGYSSCVVGQAETLAVKFGRCAPSLPLAFLRPTLRQMPCFAHFALCAQTSVGARHFESSWQGGFLRAKLLASLAVFLVFCARRSIRCCSSVATLPRTNICFRMAFRGVWRVTLCR